MSARWRCRHCGTAGWGAMPPHDRPTGVSCRASGQRSEREAKAALARRLRDSDGVKHPVTAARITTENGPMAICFDRPTRVAPGRPYLKETNDG